jgi:hypothetical protein
MVKRNDSQLHKRMEANHSDYLELSIYCSWVGNFIEFFEHYTDDRWMNE